MTNQVSPTCAHCFLPVRRASTQRTVEGIPFLFCCYGCCIAYQIRSGSREEPEAVGLLIKLGIGSFLAMNIMLFSLLIYSGTFETADSELLPYINFLLWLLTTPLMILLGVPYFRESFQEMRKFRISSSVLICLGAGSAYLYSTIMVFTGRETVYFDTVAMVLLLYTLGRYLEAIGRVRSVRNIAPMLAVERQTTQVLEKGMLIDLPIGEVRPGMEIRVKPGDRIPVDGLILEGNTHIDESVLTGESRYIEKQQGMPVFAGSLNQEGSLRIRAIRQGNDSRWAHICRNVRDAISQGSPYQDITDRVVTLFIPLVILIAGFTVFFWYGEHPIEKALMHGLAVLVVACPCAIGLAAPLVTTLGLGLLANRGCLIRGGDVIERMAVLRGIAFDKTGTLTQGMPLISKIETSEMTPDEILRTAASLESGSEHPIAKGILKEAQAKGLMLVSPTQISVFPGKGIIGQVEGKSVAIGKWQWFQEMGWHLSNDLREKTEKREDAHAMKVYIGWHSLVQGVLFYEDQLLAEAHQTLKELKKLKVFLLLLSGDQENVVKNVAEQLEIAQWQAELSPEAKKCQLQERIQHFGLTGMVGDGLNDSPVIAEASVGFAVGTATDLARETADVVLPQGGFYLLPWLIKMARSVRKTIIGNLFWAFSYNLFAIFLAMAGMLQPVLAAGLMAGSSLLVIFNSIQLEKRIGFEDFVKND